MCYTILSLFSKKALHYLNPNIWVCNNTDYYINKYILLYKQIHILVYTDLIIKILARRQIKIIRRRTIVR